MGGCSSSSDKHERVTVVAPPVRLTLRSEVQLPGNAQLCLNRANGNLKWSSNPPHMRKKKPEMPTDGPAAMRLLMEGLLRDLGRDHANQKKSDKGQKLS